MPEERGGQVFQPREAVNRPGFDAAVFCEKDGHYAQAVTFGSA
jgi:hypothetical protein